MTAPNIISITSMVGKTAVQAVGISPTNIVTNSAASNKVYKINAFSKPTNYSKKSQS